MPHFSLLFLELYAHISWIFFFFLFWKVIMDRQIIGLQGRLFNFYKAGLVWCLYYNDVSRKLLRLALSWWGPRIGLWRTLYWFVDDEIAWQGVVTILNWAQSSHQFHGEWLCLKWVHIVKFNHCNDYTSHHNQFTYFHEWFIVSITP